MSLHIVTDLSRDGLVFFKSMVLGIYVCMYVWLVGCFILF